MNKDNGDHLLGPIAIKLLSSAGTEDDNENGDHAYKVCISEA